jgi:hypothetical protein
MAVENVDTRIVQSNLKDSVAGGSIWSSFLQVLYITAHGISWIGDCAVPSAEAFGKNLEFVTMHVHWVADWNKGIRNNNT